MEQGLAVVVHVFVTSRSNYCNWLHLEKNPQIVQDASD